MSSKIRIPQVKPWLGEEEKQAVLAVLDDNWLTEGSRSQAFSERLNGLIGVPYGCFAPNGTLALVLGLMALGIGRGDEVLVPDTTFVASANSVLMVGAKPIFVDVEPETFQIDVASAEAMVSERTRAIMPVHLFGTSSDMDAIMAFAKRHRLKVIEDAAQGIGVTYDDRPVGGFGDVGCFSFFADKTLTTGEGGYVACRDPAIHERLLLLRNHGRRERGSFMHPAIGYNFRITDLQAAIGLAQLDRLQEIMRRKTAILAAYKSGLADVPKLRVLGTAARSNHVPFRCVVMCEQAEAMSGHLRAHGIEPRGFFWPQHRQPCFVEAFGKIDDARYPNAIYGFEHGVCLPIYPTLSHDQVDEIVARIREFHGES